MSKALDKAIVSTTIEMSETIAVPDADNILPPAMEEVKGDSNEHEPPIIEHASVFETVA